MLIVFPAHPQPFPGSIPREKLREGIQKAFQRSHVLLTEDGTSPLSAFQKKAECVRGLFSHPPRRYLVSQVFPGSGKSANYCSSP